MQAYYTAFHSKPLRRILCNYINDVTGKQALQENTHMVSKYFDFRTQDYFSDVVVSLFGVSAYLYRQEFAKSRGMAQIMLA